MGKSADLPVDENTLEEIRSILDSHAVSFALLFGSGARSATSEIGDIDIAVEFDGVRPEDDGYSDTYLGLLSALDEALQTDVDVVDVHTMSPQFARVVFDQGALLVGSEKRRRELERELAGESPSVSDARERIAAAVERLEN